VEDGRRASDAVPVLEAVAGRRDVLQVRPTVEADGVIELRMDDVALDRLAELVAERLGGTMRAGPSPWMTANEAAEYLRCSASRVRKLTMLGDLPTHRDGGRVLYRRDDLDAFVAHGGASTGR
jgi:excisionase family DNA binding protein